MIVSEITPEWLRSAPGWPVTDAAEIVTEAISLTNGTMGGVYRVSHGHDSLIFKCGPDVDSPWHKICVETGVLDREVEAYRFLAARRPDQPRIAPDCYWSALSSEGGGGIALQDLNQYGLSMSRFAAGLTRGETLSVIATLARLHGLLATSQGHALNPPFPWLYSASSEGLLAAVAEGLAAVPDIVERLFPADFPIRTFLRILDADVAEVFSRSHRDTKLLSICHGDCWSSNILFTSPADRGGPAAVLIDWQFSMWGNPLSDVALLLLSSLSPADRRAWLEDCLGDYHMILSGEAPGYSLEDCRNDFSRAMGAAAVVAVATLDAFTSGSGEAELAQVAARMASFIEDVPELFKQ